MIMQTSMDCAMILCETCGCKTGLGRSVKLRIWAVDGIPVEYSLGPSTWPAERRNAEPTRFKAAYEQYERNMAYRRAFVCQACYQKLDSRDGTAEIRNSE